MRINWLGKLTGKHLLIFSQIGTGSGSVHFGDFFWFTSDNPVMEVSEEEVPDLLESESLVRSGSSVSTSSSEESNACNNFSPRMVLF